MEDRYDISVDIGEGKDKGVQCWIRIGDDGKYIPATVIDTTTTISLADSVQRTGYVGVEVKECTCTALFDVNELMDAYLRLCSFKVSLSECTIGKRRKTTYKTIRRYCAKRN